MGTKLNLQNELDNKYIKAIHKISKILKNRLLRPWNILSFYYYNFSLAGKEEIRLVNVMNKFTSKVIKKREENFEKFEEPSSDMLDESFIYSRRKKLAMLDLMLNAKWSGTMDDEGIKDEVNTFMFEVRYERTSLECLIFEIFIISGS